LGFSPGELAFKKASSDRRRRWQLDASHLIADEVAKE
jgi:hypothetical protein